MTFGADASRKMKAAISHQRSSLNEQQFISIPIGTKKGLSYELNLI